MSTLLIFTVGHTDVQLVVEGQRWELDKQRTQELHQELAEREADWKLGEAPEKRAQTSWPAARCREGALLPAGELALCTPKLDAVLRWCQAHGHQLSHALILHTDRIAKRRDPTQAGPIVQRRLAEHGGVQARLVSYLTSDEMLEDRRVPQDALVRREIVTRLEVAIVEEIARSGATTIVVAAAGGFPEVSSLVRELTALHAEPRAVCDLDVPDSGRGGAAADVASERKQPTDPSAVVAAKRHALALVQRGSFIAAWGAVAHLDGEATCRPWTRVLRWLYEWASSLPRDERDGECSLPFPRPAQLAAHAAMRVELALRSEDLPRAVQGTVSFFEAAVWQHLHDGHLQRDVVSGKKGKARFRVQPPPDESEKPIKPVPATDAAGEPLYYVDNYGDGSRTIARSYLKKHRPDRVAALLALEARIEKVMHLRNAVAHSEPSVERLEEARGEMVSQKLWSDSAAGGTTSPHRFLRQPLIRDVLLELGVTEAEELCERLIAEVARRLRAPSGGAP